MARWPGEVLAKPGYVRVEAAPSPADVYWPNLLSTKERRACYYYLGYLLTAVLYLLYNVPVAAIQGLASVQQLSTIEGLDKLAEWIERQGPAAVATYQGFAASLVLQVFLYLTLYSGLFQFLARLSGATSHTDICRRAAGRVMLFQLIFVILVSSISSSLFDSLAAVLKDPTQLPYLLAGTLPGQSSFFMHYLLNQALFIFLFDATQVISLCYYIWQCAFPSCRPKPTAASEGDAYSEGSSSAEASDADASGSGGAAHTPPIGGFYSSAEEQRQKMMITWAKLTLCSGIFLTFNIIAPFITAIATLYFLPVYPLFAVVLRHVDGPPEVDTAGAFWEQATRFSTWTLLISELLLAGVLVLKESPVGAALVIFSLLYVAYHTHNLRVRYAGLAAGLPIQRSAELDDADSIVRFDSLDPYATAGLADEVHSVATRKRAQ